jgi:uncharacterized phage-like protein YoqJ
MSSNMILYRGRVDLQGSTRMDCGLQGTCVAHEKHSYNGITMELRKPFGR